MKDTVFFITLVSSIFAFGCKPRSERIPPPPLEYEGEITGDLATGSLNWTMIRFENKEVVCYNFNGLWCYKKEDK